MYLVFPFIIVNLRQWIGFQATMLTSHIKNRLIHIQTTNLQYISVIYTLLHIYRSLCLYGGWNYLVIKVCFVCMLASLIILWCQEDAIHLKELKCPGEGTRGRTQLGTSNQAFPDQKTQQLAAWARAKPGFAGGLRVGAGGSSVPTPFTPSLAPKIAGASWVPSAFSYSRVVSKTGATGAATPVLQFFDPFSRCGGSVMDTFPPPTSLQMSSKSADVRRRRWRRHNCPVRSKGTQKSQPQAQKNNNSNKTTTTLLG